MGVPRRAALLGTVLLAGLGACSDDADDATPTTAESSPATTSTAPPAPGPGDDDWGVVAPEDVGLDATVLAAMAEVAEADGSNCLLVLRDGAIAGEWYWNGTNEDSAQEVFSVTKSITSILVGIAQADGDLDVDDSASRWIPEWAGNAAEAVTVRNLLGNDSGRFWSFETDYQEMLGSADRTAFGIGLEQADPPGTVWVYNNSAIQTLEQVLEQSTGEPVPDFAAARLFGQLGMDDSRLTTDGAGNGLTFMGLQSTCRDLARFGWMVLSDGRWGDEQVIDPAWIDESTGGPSQDLNAAYGYLWWLNHRGPQADAAEPARADEVEADEDSQMVPGAPEDLVWAIGLGGQIVQVHEPTRTVVVRLGPVGSAYGPADAARLVTEGLAEP